jgi:hypothetical protein
MRKRGRKGLEGLVVERRWDDGCSQGKNLPPVADYLFPFF